jgi:hypothetical protein
VGGRLGLRYRTLKLGVSASHEKANFEGNILKVYEGPKSAFEDISRVRVGADISLAFMNCYVEGEWIYGGYGEHARDIGIDNRYYYGTLGYYITPSLFIYASYWHNREDLDIADFSVKVPTGGVSYHLHDSITFKAQIARVSIRDELKIDNDS